MLPFAEQLKKLRAEKQFSQEFLAEQLYISRQAISKWENGEASPDLENVVKLAEILEVSLDELVTGKLPQVKVVEKIEKPMNAWEYLSEESKRPLSKGDTIVLIFIAIIFLGAHFIMAYFN
ncbi:helix-turn-helix domain-containing protein [Streptococcus cameli]